LRLRARTTSTPALALAVLAGACQDAGGDPTALLAEKSHPAVALAADLPSLAGLAGDAPSTPETSAAVELWIGSWAGGAEEGEERRTAAYAGVAGPLAETLGAAGIGGALGRLDAALAVADRIARTGLPEEVAPRLAAAHAEAEAARRALGAGTLDEALRATLHGADLLREVGAEGVARTLIERAEGGLAWAGSPADPLAQVRAQRLVAGARDAAAAGEFGLAIQRAYYACQLVGVAL
jgi:hypothetical protein